MAGGLKCNPFSVTLVTIGTLLAITCIFVFLIINVPLDIETCEDEYEEVEEEVTTKISSLTEMSLFSPKFYRLYLVSTPLKY